MNQDINRQLQIHALSSGADYFGEARFDAAACDRYFKEQEKKQGVAVCGLCLWVCPHGQETGRMSKKRTQLKSLKN